MLMGRNIHFNRFYFVVIKELWWVRGGAKGAIAPPPQVRKKKREKRKKRGGKQGKMRKEEGRESRKDRERNTRLRPILITMWEISVF